MTLWELLEAKPLYYKEIDHQRIYKAYARLKPHIKYPQTVHIVGTNGKGSTGRIVAYLAYKSGLSVGHYTSPHILAFNERLWLNNTFCSQEILESGHERLYAILGIGMAEALSYFEYTTLLAFMVFESCDLMVLEAGLGGEYDATNVCAKVLSVVTPIGLDHQSFLGDTIEEIATTKLRSIEREVVLSPQPFKEVYTIAEAIAKEKGTLIESVIPDVVHHPLHQQVYTIAEERGWPAYLAENAMVACEALTKLSIVFDVEHLYTLQLFGRYYPIAPNVIVDVGHNPLAAKALVGAMEEGTILIYNTLSDKAYREVLSILQPKLKEVQILPIKESERCVEVDVLENTLQSLNLPYRYFETIEENEHYVVFGSFYVVEAFLKQQGVHSL
jgi:dihydrofolate synthase/folylpolyglutamate synthase